ncbi:carboxypeptidase-like regulatory domain-containing protein [uncultured Polaribacter sp.]|uniref:carboxypeptidase-like regulatory domain-containing protein n=1 Tax=uncultured Polaribacter sp. TaxID=174711 RepID=UPI002603A58D|nr:carboxypeptidase-like regulatory domain-containing protein [uncultured Polaribacter sp.]
MTKKILLTHLFLCVTVLYYGQTISGKVFSKNSNKAIDKVAISTNLKTGTTSNRFGNYTLNLNNVDFITFSCLGYQTKTFTIINLRKLNFKVHLAETVNQLDEIELKIAKISLDSLLMKTCKSMKENYVSETVKQEIYISDAQKMNFQKLDLELKTSSLIDKKNRKSAQHELEEFSNRLLIKSPEFTTEFSGSLFSKKITSKKTKKTFTIVNVDSVLGYKKNEIEKGLTLNSIQEKFQNIVLKHLNTNKTYKIKTGLFKIEDSLSFKKLSEISDSIKKDNSYGEFKITNYKRDADVTGVFVLKENASNFLSEKYYKHQLEKSEYLGANKFYVISFEPRKSKAKFLGKVYVDPIDFTLKKVVYKFAKGKRGDHINLKWVLGVKYSENENSGIIYYEKDPLGKVFTSYYRNTTKNYAYINRPIKFIENSKDKEKVKFNIKIEVVVSENTEILLKNTISILKESVKGYKKEDFKKRQKYISKEMYLSSNWKDKQLVKEYLKKYE